MTENNKKKTEDCRHQWAPLLAQVKKKTTPSLVKVCLRCGELKIGQRTIRMSRYRLDMGNLPIKNLGNRWGKANLEWTLDKLLKGAGAGADPTEIDMLVGVPSGLIAMWHGLIANIPSGWVICDGNNGTPNLLAKFVEGVATAATNPGATGGSTSKTTTGHKHETDIASSWDGNTYQFARQNAANPFGSGTTVDMRMRTSITQLGLTNNVARALTQSKTDSISDIRPLFYDVAFIMKT